jgi:hypothetical protein
MGRMRQKRRQLREEVKRLLAHVEAPDADEDAAFGGRSARRRAAGPDLSDGSVG